MIKHTSSPSTLLSLVLLSWILLMLAPLARAATPDWMQSRSPHDVAVTMQRLERAVDGAGLKVFARIDHAAAAHKVGMKLRPTQLLIFGNPKAGTLLMQCSQTAGIDLPLKMLVWQDADGQTWLGYTNPQAIAQRHGAADCAVVPKMRALMHKLMEQAAQN
ncbi:MAG: DUF302 domain-containing protein [Thiomonas sp.]